MTTKLEPLDRYDAGRIAKLEKLTNLDTYWSDVAKLTRNVVSETAHRRWDTLSQQRWEELNGLPLSPAYDYWLDEDEYEKMFG